MATFVWSDAFLQSVETALAAHATAPDLSAATCDLFSNVHTPGRGDDAGAYTPCAFTGYGQVPVTFAGPFPDSVHGPFLEAGLLDFTVGSPALLTDTAQGYYLKDGAGNLIGALQFDSPVEMAMAGAHIALAIQLRLRDY